MPRYFSLLEAERLLPDVEQLIRRALTLKADHASSDKELQQASYRIFLLGGAMIDHDRLLAERTQRDTCATQLKEILDKIQDSGCLVKDLDIGLVDFPTLFRGQEVYLCWKLGESGIQYWHGVEEGYRGRKPIDRDFLDHHRGESQR
jgi:hypothetical protein